MVWSVQAFRLSLNMELRLARPTDFVKSGFSLTDDYISTIGSPITLTIADSRSPKFDLHHR